MPSAIVAFIDEPASFRLAGDFVYFDLPTGTACISGVMHAENFIESFGRAAEIAHQWSARRYGSVVKFPAKPKRVV